MLAAAVVAEKDASGKLTEVRAEMAATEFRLAKAEAALQVSHVICPSRDGTHVSFCARLWDLPSHRLPAQHGVCHKNPSCCQVSKLNLCSLPAASAGCQSATSWCSMSAIHIAERCVPAKHRAYCHTACM